VKNKHNKTSALNVALAYVGAVVGAGFISGQELAQFFIQFGFLGLLGWLVVVFVIILGGGKAIQSLTISKYHDLSDLMESLCGNKVAKLANIITIGYLIGGVIIMVSGASTIVSEMFRAPLFIGIIMITSLMFLVISGESQRLLSVKKYLVPILILSTVWVVFVVFSKNGLDLNLNQDYVISNPSRLLTNWILSVFLYLGYNIIGAAVSFINISKGTDSKSGKYGGYLGGLIVSILGSLLIIGMLMTYPDWNTFDLPLVKIVQNEVPFLYVFFSLSMVIAMFTVASNYALGLAYYLEDKVKFGLKTISLILLIFTGVSALLGFSTLLGIIYPIFGILATMLFMWIFFYKVFKIYNYPVQKEFDI
jgi:uncharacterized membrane protein YkvI